MCLRTIIALLAALAIASAPIGVAWASIRGASSSQIDARAAMAGMADCAKMAQQAGQGSDKSDCACCDTKNACPPQFCLSKCFKVPGEIMQLVLPVIGALVLRPSGPDRPPDWSHTP